MECIRWYITPLLFVTFVLADYFIDNAYPFVIYSTPHNPFDAWKTYSMTTQPLELSVTNSTGNYTITVDPSQCYNHNYAFKACTADQNCFVQVPFTGSGITIYVLNAGLTGMTANFSVDGGPAVTSSISPPPPPTYQVPNVSLYSIQGLTTGSHTIKMTLMDWDGVATSMKFDYALAAETYVVPSMTTSSTSLISTSTSASQTPTQKSTGTSTNLHKSNAGRITGATLGGSTFLAVLVIGSLLYLRRIKTKTQQDTFLTPESTFQVHPFPSEPDDSAPPSIPNVHRRSSTSIPAQRLEVTPISPLARSAILRDALTAGNQSLESTRSGSGQGPAVALPQRRQPWPSRDVKSHVRSSTPLVADAGLQSLDPRSTLRYNLTVEQVGVIDQLRADNVPPDTISRVLEGFVSSGVLEYETNDGTFALESAATDVGPPPSYESWDGEVDD